jgi:hypothetical protein
MRKQRKPLIDPAQLNPRRRSRPRSKWRYEGPASAEDWIDRADGKARMCRAIAALNDGRSTNARHHRELSDMLLQGIVCVHQLMAAK